MTSSTAFPTGHHGQSELLDAVVAARPEVDRERHGSTDELAERSLTHVSRAVAMLDADALGASPS